MDHCGERPAGLGDSERGGTSGAASWVRGPQEAGGSGERAEVPSGLRAACFYEARSFSRPISSAPTHRLPVTEVCSGQAGGLASEFSLPKRMLL